VEKGKVPKQKASAKKGASGAKKGKGRDTMKTIDSDSEHEVIIGSEDELGASPSHWKVATGSSVKITHELPTFTIKTRLSSALAENSPQEPMDTDDEFDELDPSPSKMNVTRRGTKRKAQHDPSSTSKSLSHSSQKWIPEVVIMVPSPKKRLAHS